MPWACRLEDRTPRVARYNRRENLIGVRGSRAFKPANVYEYCLSRSIGRRNLQKIWNGHAIYNSSVSQQAEGFNQRPRVACMSTRSASFSQSSCPLSGSEPILLRLLTREVTQIFTFNPIVLEHNLERRSAYTFTE